MKHDQLTSALPTISPAARSVIDWEEFRQWAADENVYQKKISGVHEDNHPSIPLRGRSYFEVNVYRYFHALQVCWPYLDRPNQKIMDVGSWPGGWLRVIAHFARRHQPEVWASGLIFPPDFLERMDGACQGIARCELDPRSPMSEHKEPTKFSQDGFTFVSAMEVVEHLHYPADMFRILHEAMTPGGILFLTTNNVNRLANLYTLVCGGGLVGNLDELNPRGGGILGDWRPHAREYAWRELDAIATGQGFRPLSHGFYQENYALRLIEGDDVPNEELTFSEPREERFARDIRPLLNEPEQLKSGMYLLFERK